MKKNIFLAMSQILFINIENNNKRMGVLNHFSLKIINVILVRSKVNHLGIVWYYVRRYLYNGKKLLQYFFIFLYFYTVPVPKWTQYTTVELFTYVHLHMVE